MFNRFPTLLVSAEATFGASTSSTWCFGKELLDTTMAGAEFVLTSGAADFASGRFKPVFFTTTATGIDAEGSDGTASEIGALVVGVIADGVVVAACGCGAAA